MIVIHEQWTADLIEVINIGKYKRGYRYLLTVVDVFSKRAWVEPVKNKTGQTLTEAFEKILKQGRTAINLQTESTDDEKEFYNKTFQGLMLRKGLHHFSTSSDTKAGMVKQFNRIDIQATSLPLFHGTYILSFSTVLKRWSKDIIVRIIKVLGWLLRK